MADHMAPPHNRRIADWLLSTLHAVKEIAGMQRGVGAPNSLVALAQFCPQRFRSDVDVTSVTGRDHALTPDELHRAGPQLGVPPGTTVFEGDLPENQGPTSPHQRSGR